jgi:acetyl-CoA C-acetyltransferase
VKSKVSLSNSAVYIVDGSRTPFLKAKGVGTFSASDLAVQCGQALLKRLPIEPHHIDEVIVGAAMPGPDEANIARVIAIRLGCGDKVPAFTVMRNCASGMQSIDTAARNISLGRSHLVLAGGTEAMSRAPILFDLAMADWLGKWMSCKGLQDRAKVLAKFKPNFLIPIFGLLRGLSDPLIGMNMGQTAEELAYEFQIDRLAMDTFAVESHLKLAAAYEKQLMTEVNPIIDTYGNVYTHDTGFRADSNLEGLAKLKPVFDKKYGMVTAGNSSQVSDGACMLLLASEQAVKEHQLPVLGKLVDSQWSALEPVHMGLGPVHAISQIMERHQLKFDDVDVLEINEAFAAQVIACIAAWDDKAYCKDVLKLKHDLGEFDKNKLNIQGGAIAAGHPVGASGARIVLHTLHLLRQKKLQKGIASLCIGGGQGGAMYLEAVKEI